MFVGGQYSPFGAGVVGRAASARVGDEVVLHVRDAVVQHTLQRYITTHLIAWEVHRVSLTG